MDLGLAGKRALVLGGNRGIGFGIARALSREGAAVAIVARDAARLEAARAEIAAEGGGPVFAETGDLAATDAIGDLVRRVEARLAGIDILIANTGGPTYGGVSGVGLADWRRSFEEMVLSVFALAEAVLPGMRARRWGRIVTVASSGVIQPIPILGISNTLRAGIAAWSKTLSNEVARDGITVNMLIPGRIATERVAATDRATAEREGITVDEVARRSHAQIPVGRYGTIDETGAMVAFLCSMQASYVTGSMMRCDGGYIRAV